MGWLGFGVERSGVALIVRLRQRMGEETADVTAGVAVRHCMGAIGIEEGGANIAAGEWVGELTPMIGGEVLKEVAIGAGIGVSTADVRVDEGKVLGLDGT